MLPQRRYLIEILTAAALIAAPFVLPWLGFAPNTVYRILVWGLFGLGFDILFGFTGLLSFGQSAFYGTGGFVAAYLLTRTGFSSVVGALIIGMIAAAATGYLVGLVALRRTGIYFAMIAVALAGGLLGVLQACMPPDAFTFDTSGQLVMQTAIGGRATLFGPLVGAAVWLFLQDFLQAALGLGAAWKLVLGVVLVLLVRFPRGGIIGGLADLYRFATGKRSKEPSPEET